jgi:hypothetical protein
LYVEENSPKLKLYKTSQMKTILKDCNCFPASVQAHK